MTERACDGSDSRDRQDTQNKTDEGRTMTTTSKLVVLVNVDQRESIRRGIGADSTARIEVDLSTMTEEQRQWLADNFDGGKIRMTVPEPTEAGLRESLEEAISDYREAKLAEAQRRAELSAKIVAGEDPYVSCQDLVNLTTEARAILSEREKARQERNEAARLDSLKANQERVEREEAAAARLKAQRDEFAAQVGVTLAARWRDGWAKGSEIDEAIKNDACRIFGVPPLRSLRDWDREDYAEIGTCSDEQYEKMSAWLAMLPDEAKSHVRLFDYHNHDEDEKSVDRLVVAETWWKMGEIVIESSFQIGTLPDEV